MNELRTQSAAEKRRSGLGRLRAGVAAVSLLAGGVLAVVVTASVTNAQSFDGAYKGTFSGSASGTVEFSVAGSQVTVSQPGSGSGSVSGSSINMVAGNATVSGFTCRYESTGELAFDGSGAGTASGTWNATCDGGATGNGTWEATRPAAAASPSPSATAQPTARNLSLTATPRSLSKPGRTRLTATLSQCTSESFVDFQVRRDGVFQTLATVGVDEHCKASTRRRVARKSAFRAQSPSDGGFAGAVSRVVTVRVDRR